MLRNDDEEKEILNEKKKRNDIFDILGMTGDKKKKKKRKKASKKKIEEDKEGNLDEYEKKQVNPTDCLFNIIGRYDIIRMLGFGSFGEIHLAYDNQLRSLIALKLEGLNVEIPQLKNEFKILEQLNKNKNEPNQNRSIIKEGVPKVYRFETLESKCNLMAMEFLGPSLSDLFQFTNKKFTLTTVLLLGLQMIQRIEMVHDKGYIHRDIKPENFVVGLNEKSNIIYIIDFGLSTRYKDKTTGLHNPYRENRHLVGTARYASINSHLGIQQSRRDDIESIGYVLVYFLTGKLPWQTKGENNKSNNKIMEKKMATPPELLCNNLPEQFAYYFHYCKGLRYEDQPDYGILKVLFWDLLTNNGCIMTDFIFDWYKEEDDEQENKNSNKTINPNDEINLLGITPGKVGSSNIENSENVTPIDNKKNNLKVKHKSKVNSIENSFSDSESPSESSGSEKNIKKKDKKNDFNLLKNSFSNESEKNKKLKKIDEEIQFRSSYEDTYLNVNKK